MIETNFQNNPIEPGAVAISRDPSKPGPLRRLWADLREAIAGSEQDFTEGHLGRAILLLSVPMVLEMVMESVFAVVDVFFVARLGADAVATVGLTESVITLVYSIAIGLSMAITAMVARRIGEKDSAGATVAAVQALALGVLASLPIAVIGIFLAPDILRLMGASPGIVANGSGYMAVMLGGNITIMLIFLINAIFRGAGDAAIAMRSLWLANLINCVLDPCFIFGWGPFPEMGVTGAAVATNIGRGVGVLYQLYALFYGKSRIQIQGAQFRLDFEVMWRLVRVSLGGIFQFLVATASWLGLVRIVAIFGSAALAGYTIALRIIVFALLPSWGMSNAAATLVGQNLGADKPGRAERSVWFTGLCNVIFLGLVTIVFVVFAEPLVYLFTRDSEVVPFAVDCLRYVSYGYIFYAFGMVMVQAFNGAGDTVTPTIINLCCYWLFQIPLAYGLALPFDFGARGVFAAITIAESTLAVVAVLVFRRGKWKERKI
ncbi:MATE family efflux transporter [candidate division KSB1 bacterium]|nr:MAG: MATE family efflux transporter [candidate division KSB1 bacterium]MBC6948593.1 MATE family efflux transporter [candidate division KSB1 bacterium]MCE7942210.1 MATE family efflux transporter [Chlorobi bacterium CHB1]MDL1876431.1 MATE family efflux transporter [Cytophagia bacterium CHB2]